MERQEKFTGFIISCVLFLANITFLAKNITAKNVGGWIIQITVERPVRTLALS